MLFGYPNNATADNWLHDCMLRVLEAMHYSLDTHKSLSSWSSLAPVQYKDLFDEHPSLKVHLQKYRAAAKKLTSTQRGQVFACMISQNCIVDLLNGSVDCDQIEDLPVQIQTPIKELFKCAFKLLIPLGIRDKQYATIYEHISDKICPFCGLESFDGPGALREDLDHYLAKSIYPFAAINLHNLPPMGSRCNTYKAQQDIIHNKDGTRRNAFYPYAPHNISFSLVQSNPFSTTHNNQPHWQIDFVPFSQECATWDTVFHISERIQRDILKVSYQRWLGEFATWFKKNYDASNITNNNLTSSVQTYYEDQAIYGLRSREFLRTAVFEMLLIQCEQGNNRLLDQLRDLIILSST